MMQFFRDASVSDNWLRALRIGTGAFLALGMLALWPDLPMLYGRDGLVPLDLLAVQRGGVGFTVHDWAAYMERTVGSSYDCGLWLLAAAYILLACLLACHWRIRWVAGVLLVLHAGWFTIQPNWSYGYDYLAASALFYCLVFPVARASDAGGTVYIPFLRILQLHLCIIYFFGGLGKLLGPSWRNGEAIWKALSQPYHVEQHDWLQIASAYPAIFVLAGWVVVVLELLYPIAIWVPGIRTWWMWAVVAMHLGIALLMGLYLFSAWMILLNLVAFYYPYAYIIHGKSRPMNTAPPVPILPSKPGSRDWRDTRKGGITY